MSETTNNLTEEQKGLIDQFMENYDKSKDVLHYSDEDFFVIPFVAMNDGRTMAQIRTQNKGLYKDIQRSPFIRKTGIVNEKGCIADLDITSLVYYGSLEQSKVAPTLENVDIKLYFREPNLTKVPDNKGSATGYADAYIWREIPAGFHVYNNDTVYGYEWLVLQDDYVDTDGIYNLHMNIEDGLGLCKFAGTQAPISLKGVQYKIVVTAKSLWSREYSLLDSTPLAHTLGSYSDELSPSVKAVRDWYEESLLTLKVVTDTLYAGKYKTEDGEVEYGLTVVGDTATAKKLIVGGIEDLEEYVKLLRTDLDTHIDQVVSDVRKDENGKVLGVHGIINDGAKGNINARALAGATLSNGRQALVENVPEHAYIPFVDENNCIGIGIKTHYFNRSGNADPALVLTRSVAVQSDGRTLQTTETSEVDGVDSLLKVFTAGASYVNCRICKVDDEQAIKISAGNLEKQPVNLMLAKVTTDEIVTDKLKANRIDLGEGMYITKDKVLIWDGGSSIAYKVPISELLSFNLKDADNEKYVKLTPNTPVDVDGRPVGTLDTKLLEDSTLRVISETDVTAFSKLGSALQALYELPMGTYKYKRGQAEYKTQLGIFVERVNQIRDNLANIASKGETAEGNADSENYLAHKRNTYIQSAHPLIKDRLGGKFTYKDDLKVLNNSYTYTEDEIQSIVHYLDLTTNKKELGQEVRNTVGMLLVAAKETQERLLDVETAVYGFDAKTLPGDPQAKVDFINNRIDAKLRDQLTNNPLLLGLNRLMRAILLELYDTTDLDKIDAEMESRVTDSDTLGSKVSIKSRLDQVDEIASNLNNQCSALVQYYCENILNDESGHTYTDIVNASGIPFISDEGLVENSTIKEVVANLKDSHEASNNRDAGGLWKNLPSKDDLVDIDSVGFAQVAESAHKHTPSAEESGVVRIPVVETVAHEDKTEYGDDTVRNWKKLKVEKTKFNEGDDYPAKDTYLPIFKSKAVAWDSAKLERINTKLSEVTKTIYGTDDVIAKLPNRTEVLRRNITNLVDDLYPNRLFKIENPIAVENDPTAKFYLPFKKSHIQVPESADVSVAGNFNNDENFKVQHKSIIPWFDNEIFNFTISNNYINPNLNNTKYYDVNHQVTLDSGSKQIICSTKLLVTDDETPNSSYGTYGKAVSRVDILESLLGVTDCYIKDLYAPSSSILNVNAAWANVLGEVAGQPGIEKQQAAIQELKDAAIREQNNAKKTLAALESELQQKKADIASCNDKIAKLTQQRDYLVEQVTSLTKDEESQSTTIKTLNTQIAELETQKANLLNEQAKLESRLTEYKNARIKILADKALASSELNLKQISLKNLETQMTSDLYVVGGNWEIPAVQVEDNSIGGFSLSVPESEAQAHQMLDLIAVYPQRPISFESLTLNDWAKQHLASDSINGVDALIEAATNTSKLYTVSYTGNATSAGTIGNINVERRDSNNELIDTVDENYKLTIEDTYEKGLTTRETVPKRGGTKTQSDKTLNRYCLGTVTTLKKQTKKTVTAHGVEYDIETKVEGEGKIIEGASTTHRSETRWYTPEAYTQVQGLAGARLQNDKIELPALEFESSFMNISTVNPDWSEIRIGEWEVVTSNEEYNKAGFTKSTGKSGWEWAQTYNTVVNSVETSEANYELTTKYNLYWKNDGETLVHDYWERLGFNNQAEYYLVAGPSENGYRIYKKDTSGCIETSDTFKLEFVASNSTKLDVVPAGISVDNTEVVFKLSGGSELYKLELEPTKMQVIRKRKYILDFVTGHESNSTEDGSPKDPSENGGSDNAGQRIKVFPAVNGGASDTLAFPRIYTCDGEATIDLLAENFDQKPITFAYKHNFTGNGVSWSDDKRAEIPADECIADTQKIFTDIKTSILGTAGTFENPTKNSVVAQINEDLAKLRTQYTELQSELKTEYVDLSNKYDTTECDANIATTSAELESNKTQTNTLSKQIAEKSKDLQTVAANLSTTQINKKDCEAQRDDVIRSLETEGILLEQLSKRVEQLEGENGNIAEETKTIASYEEKIGEYNRQLTSLVANTPTSHILSYNYELGFENLFVDDTSSIYNKDELAVDILQSSSVGFVLSRKLKPIQARITTLEAFADSVSKALSYANDINSRSYSKWHELADNDLLGVRRRFEAIDNWTALKRIVEVAEYRQREHRIFDLDLARSLPGCEEHNRKVWQFISMSDSVTKTDFSIGGGDLLGSYDVSGVLVVDPEVLTSVGLNDYAVKWNKYDGRTIHVQYYKTGTKISTLSQDVIYLEGRETTSQLGNFYKTANDPKATSLLNTDKGWSNQSEYLIYKTINNLFASLLNAGANNTLGLSSSQNENNLFYTLMKLVYPVGSIYLDVYVSDNRNDVNSLNPGVRFGGKWALLEEGVLVADPNATNTTHTGEASRFGAISPIKSSTAATALTVGQIPSHSHYMRHVHGPGSYEITGTFTNDDNRARICSGAFSYAGDVYHNDGWDGWVRNSLMEFKASRSWSGVSGESPDYTNSTGNSEVLKPENLKRHRVLAWIRIA